MGGCRECDQSSNQQIPATSRRQIFVRSTTKEISLIDGRGFDAQM
jgi:hypothetical protein